MPQVIDSAYEDAPAGADAGPDAAGAGGMEGIKALLMKLLAMVEAQGGNAGEPPMDDTATEGTEPPVGAGGPPMAGAGPVDPKAEAMKAKLKILVGAKQGQ